MKVLVLICKIVCGMFVVIWGLFSDNHESEVYEFLHDSGIDSVFDWFSGGFITFVGYNHFIGGNIDIHNIFESILFYVGGLGSLIWILFRLKLALLDHQLKSEQLKSVEKENQLKDALLQDLEKNYKEVNDLKKHLKDGREGT